MVKKISSKDIKDWKKFISSNEPIKNKDIQIEEKANIFFKTKKIDLHGCSLEKANVKIENLLTKFYKENVSKVIVITGKGIRSDNDKNPYISKDLSLLRYSVPDFLNRNENLLKIIKKITKADIKDGGEGAFYIFLKKIKE